MESLVVLSGSLDVYENLAMEELLLDHVASSRRVLFFCRNAPCVVIGKNQNPWQECHFSAMKPFDVRLARRISGGGTVYHDPGNLNYALMMPRTAYRQAETFEKVIGALQTLGLSASPGKNHSLLCEGQKFSGHAFCYRRDVVLHHGTMLLKADLALLNTMLQPVVQAETSRAVASVRAQTMNLCDVRPDLTWEKLAETLAHAFSNDWENRVDARSFLSAHDDEVARHTQRLQSREWLFGMTPAFTILLPDGRRAWIEKGRFQSLEKEGKEVSNDWKNAWLDFQSLEKDHPTSRAFAAAWPALNDFSS